MSKIISRATPVNVLEEKEKFFASSTYNPQFIYDAEVSTAELTHWGMPQERLYNYAVKMLPTTHPTVRTPDQTLTTQEIQDYITQFNDQQTNIEPIQVYFSNSYVSRCRIRPGAIFFQLPITYTKVQFASLMRHELETHILRLHNNLQQPWASQKFPDNAIRRTEEGLANLHSFIFRPDKKLRKTFCSYTATWVSQHGSFRDVYDTLRSHDFDPNTSWNVAVKVKRGTTDTSRPGGITKEICYLEGTVQLWDWIINQKNDPHQLYIGRVGIEQLAELAPQAKTAGLVYPSFFKNMEVYYQEVAAIGETNNFAELV